MQPVENIGTGSSQVDVRQKTEGEEEANREERATTAVDIAEDLRGVTLLGESGKGTATTVHTGDTDGHNGNQDDQVHEVIETVQTSILADQDKRRRGGIMRAGVEQMRVIS